MTRQSIKLNSVISTDKVKIFNTDQGVLIGHVEGNTFNSDVDYSNVFNMLDVNRNTMISNLYPIEQLDGQTFNTTLQRSEQTNTSDDYVKQYNADNLGYKSLTQINGYGFLLSNETIDGLRELSYDTISGKVIENRPVNIFVYPPSGDIELSGTSEGWELSGYDGDLLSNMIPLYNLSNVTYNYLGDINGNNTYFDYDNAIFFSNHTPTKTHLNQNWDTGSMVSGVSTIEVSSTLINTRSYNNIGSSGNILFMTYKHDKSYTSESVSTSGENGGREYDDYTIETLSLSSTTITDIPMSGYIDTIDFESVSGDGDDFAKQFEYIETVDINIIGTNGENDIKTNMYSINIQNANINTNDDIDDIEKIRIKKSISNIIKDVIESCTPVNTQLGNIYWNGD